LSKGHGAKGAIIAEKGCNSDEDISPRKKTLFPIQRIYEVYCDVAAERRTLRIGICEDSLLDMELIEGYLFGMGGQSQ